MGNKLQRIMEELRRDHHNMAILLDLLEKEVNRIRDDEEPDYELLTDIMRYMTVYSDAVHHPREDLIYERMRAVSPQLTDDLEPIEEDHQQIAELGETLRSDVEAAVSGTPVRRERVTDDMSEYVERLRAHMKWEESDLFKKADEVIEKSPEFVVDDSHFLASDPVFGEVREASFSNLLKNIEAEAEYQQNTPQDTS